MKILVTGAAGFIGMHTTLALLARGDQVVGIDNMNDYYDPQLKRDRLAHIARQHPQAPSNSLKWMWPTHRHCCICLKPNGLIESFIWLRKPVRYSLQNPHAYAQSNLVGFVNILEGVSPPWCAASGLCQQFKYVRWQHQDAVFGGRLGRPPCEPLRCNQEGQRVMAYTYSHL